MSKRSITTALAVVAALAGVQVTNTTPKINPTPRGNEQQQTVAAKNGTTTRQVEEDHFGGYTRGIYDSLMRDVGIPPKVWGQSRACARMVRKSHMRSLGIRASRI